MPVSPQLLPASSSPMSQHTTIPHNTGLHRPNGTWMGLPPRLVPGSGVGFDSPWFPQSSTGTEDQQDTSILRQEVFAAVNHLAEITLSQYYDLGIWHQLFFICSVCCMLCAPYALYSHRSYICSQYNLCFGTFGIFGVDTPMDTWDILDIWDIWELLKLQENWEKSNQINWEWTDGPMDRPTVILYSCD